MYFYNLDKRKEAVMKVAELYLREEQIKAYLDDVIDENKPHNIHDKGYKDLFAVKRNFIEFVKTFMKVNLDVELTEDNITLMDKEFITKDFDKQESDVIYEVKADNKVIYFVLLELQSRVDRKMAYRILNYMVEIWRKWEKGRKTEEKFILPKIIPCVLYNGTDKWTAPIELKGLYDGNIGEEEEYLVNFKYILIDIYRYKPEDLLKLGSVISSVFYLDTSRNDDMEIRLKRLGETVRQLNKEQVELLADWIKNVFSTNNEVKEKVEQILVKGEECDVWNCVKVMDELLNDKVNIGREKGIAEGRAKGIVEGRIEGMVEGRVETIKRLVSYKLNIILNFVGNHPLQTLNFVVK